MVARELEGHLEGHPTLPLETPKGVSSKSGTLCKSWGAQALFLIKAGRPGFWLTAMWFYLLPLGGQIHLDSPRFWAGLLYVGFPLGMLIYALNDLSDTEIDKVNPRKDSFLFGARPTPAQLAIVPLCAVVIQIPFIALFWYWLGPRILLWLVVLALGLLSYNGQQGLFKGAKGRPGVDVLAQAGYTLVFLLTYWLNGLPVGSWSIFAFGALFSMHSHLIGEIMDIEPDALSGRRTTAVCIGVVRTKLLIAALLLIESGLALYLPNKPWLVIGIFGASLLYIVDAFWVWRAKPYGVKESALFFVGWNVFLVAEVIWSAWWRSR